MPYVHFVSGHSGTAYFSTRREADRFWRRSDGQYDDGGRVDAVAECERLDTLVDETERARVELLVALKELVAVAPLDLLRGTAEGRAVRLLGVVDPGFVESCRLTVAEGD